MFVNGVVSFRSTCVFSSFFRHLRLPTCWSFGQKDLCSELEVPLCDALKTGLGFKYLGTLHFCSDLTKHGFNPPKTWFRPHMKWFQASKPHKKWFHPPPPTAKKRKKKSMVSCTQAMVSPTQDMVSSPQKAPKLSADFRRRRGASPWWRRVTWSCCGWTPKTSRRRGSCPIGRLRLGQSRRKEDQLENTEKQINRYPVLEWL